MNFLFVVGNDEAAQRRLVLGFGADRSGAGRGGQAHAVNTERQAQGTRSNYGPLARVAGQARRVPLGKREMECQWSHVTQEPSSAELGARVKMRGRRGKVSRGLSEDPESGRPAGHASPLQIHRASSFKFSSCKRSPSAALAAARGTENRAGQGPRATAGCTS